MRGELTGNVRAGEIDQLTRAEAITFGDLWVRSNVNEFLASVVNDVFDGQQIRSTFFRSGRVAAVYGLQLKNGQKVVVKIIKASTPVVADRLLERLSVVYDCQKTLFKTHFPCPRPLVRPTKVLSFIITIDEYMPQGRVGNGHVEADRRLLAFGMATQVKLLQHHLSEPLVSSRPAWCNIENGPWPATHDALFDFSSPVDGFHWVDQLAYSAAEVTNSLNDGDVVAHCDWTFGNVSLAPKSIASSYDWDSLVQHSEAVLVGLSAGGFTQGSPSGSEMPAPREVAAFLAAYGDGRGVRLSSIERAKASAAATWGLAYNARCGVTLLGMGIPQGEGTALDQLRRYGREYLAL